MQHLFLHIVVRADDSLKTKISWMHFGRFPFNQNLRNFGNSGNWYSIFPEKFPDFRKLFPFLVIFSQNREPVHRLPKCEPFNQKFQKFRSRVESSKIWVYIAKMLFHSVLEARSTGKFKPDVLIERSGAHAKVTKFVINCAPFAPARESSTKKVSLVNFSFSITGWSMKS